MTFFPQTDFPLTPSAVKKRHDLLKQQEADSVRYGDIFVLLSARTAFFDELLQGLWRQFELERENLCLAAVGGYGRQEMFPLSDLDLLILSEQPPAEKHAENITALIQFLWDCGFQVGQSVRTLAECESEGKKDLSVATNLLEARYLSGQAALFEQLHQLTHRPDFWAIGEFFEAKMQEKAERYHRYRNTAYNLEPDIKYSPGGLRDLHLIYWIARRHSGAENLADMLQSGFIRPEEYRRLMESQAFLFKVRLVLHLILKRPDNRLLFDRQIQISEKLGFEGNGNQGVEALMKRFFQALGTLSRLSEVLTKHFQEHYLSPIYDVFIQDLDDDFQLINGSLHLKKGDILSQTPHKILDLFFHLTRFEQAELHSSTLRQLYAALQNLPHKLCEHPLAREKFLRLFGQPRAIQRALLPMHRYGVLTAYLSQWADIEGLMQFDLFHIYTVDEHTLRVMLKLEDFLTAEAADSHPICHRIFTEFPDRTLLYLAALFHDIAKGRGGDHAELGGGDVARFAELHGFDQRETATLKWLVEAHLLMSVTAQRRDIHDPEVVLQFAEQVKNQVRLDALTCLTVADICATNETLWNGWKRALFGALYDYTARQFRQGLEQLLNNQEKVADHKQQAMQRLKQAGFFNSEDTLTAFWTDFPDEYFLRNSPPQIAWHSGLIRAMQGDILVKISNRFADGSTEIFIYCPDKPHLFRNVVGTIGAKKCRIHHAQILTADNGYVLDSFIITENDGSLLSADRRRQLETALRNVLQRGNASFAEQGLTRKLQHFSVKTDVRFLKESKKEHTELEIIALDKPGLLAQISRIFADLNLNLRHAKITTVGEKAEDFFILTTTDNHALTAAQRQTLEQRILTELA